MARRRRGRFMRSKSSPDRGWWLESGGISMTFPASPGPAGNHTSGTPIVFFEDLNADNVLIAGEKPDWFLKRLIIDLYPSFTGTVDGIELPARFWEASFATMGIENNALVLFQGYNVIGDEYHELSQRVLRQYSRPVYNTYSPKVLAGNPQGANLNAGVSVGNPAPPTDRQVSGEPWGPASVRDDFEVSNVNVREQAALYMHLSMSQYGGTADWGQDEVLTVRYVTRLLLQKRRT